MTPAEKAYQEWLNVQPYNIDREQTFTAGYEAGVRAAAEIMSLSTGKTAHVKDILALLEKP